MRFYDFENFLSVFLTNDIFVTFLFSNVYFKKNLGGHVPIVFLAVLSNDDYQSF